MKSRTGIGRNPKAHHFRKPTGEAAGYAGTHRGVAARRWEELREFRAAHPPKRAIFGGVSWDYIVGGEGEGVILFLPGGGTMVGESGFTRFPAFEDRYRVIAPNYARVSSAERLLDGLAGILDAEGVDAAHVLGASFGGLVAQCFVRRHPGRVRSLILANAFVPPRKALWPARVFLALLPFVPLAWLRAHRGRTVARPFTGVPSVPQEEQAFWSAYQRGLASRLTKAELLDMYRLGVDLVDRCRIEPGELSSFPGRVLILESDRDIVTPGQRAELRRCYPRAGVHTFHGAGHTPWMSHNGEYVSVVGEFIHRQEGDGP